MYLALLAFGTAFFITYFSIPAIINLSLVKKLYDLPDERKRHNARIGSLGGIAIFSGFIFAFIFFTHKLYYPQLNSLLAGSLILFAIGIKDDLYPLTPFKKFGGQLAAAIIVIIQGDIRIQSFYGLFDIHNLDYYTSVALSIPLFLLLINSFNFIDGINGLAGSIGVVVISTFAWFFYLMGETLFLIMCLAYVGALLAFLRYNFGNARIFMGDSGSMVLGFIITVISIFFVQKSVYFVPNIFFAISSAVFGFAVLIIPIFDTMRVIAIRVFILKRSPFAADRNHIHHALLDIGLGQMQATLILVGTNVFFIILALLLQDVVVPKFQMIIYIILALGLSQIPFIIKRKRKKKLQAAR
ncbi:MAG: MraY family glycosyltransferase [Owenweeksia sp.]